MDRLWWNQVPNALRFVNSIIDELQDEKNVVLALPQYVPWYLSFRERIESLKSQLLSNYVIKNIIDDVQEGKINKENINQELFSDYLYTKDSPDPDLIIRPSGEQRISNFLLWQCAYSEFWYSNVNWPDFSEKDLQRAIYDYQNRDRRFGGV